jgi:hypothetical protein
VEILYSDLLRVADARQLLELGLLPASASSPALRIRRGGSASPEYSSSVSARQGLSATAPVSKAFNPQNFSLITHNGASREPNKCQVRAVRSVEVFEWKSNATRYRMENAMARQNSAARKS